jgi:hypothetical protein
VQRSGRCCSVLVRPHRVLPHQFRVEEAGVALVTFPFARLLPVKPCHAAPDDGCVFVAFLLRERDLHDHFVIHN